MEIKNALNYRESIVLLLTAEKLPVNDLPDILDNFVVAVENDKLIGAAGLEIYGDYGLLRSLAVRPGFRDQGIAAKLVKNIEAHASAKGLRAIYLLTETATDYFLKKNYEKITRAGVPDAIQVSSEFSYACPQSAIVMKKTLEISK